MQRSTDSEGSEHQQIAIMAIQHGCPATIRVPFPRVQLGMHAWRGCTEGGGMREMAARYAAMWAGGASGMGQEGPMPQAVQ